MSVHQVHACFLHRSEESIRSPGPGVTNGTELPCCFRNRTQVLWTTEPSHRPSDFSANPSVLLLISISLMSPQNIIWVYLTRDQRGYTLQGLVDCPSPSSYTPNPAAKPSPPPGTYPSIPSERTNSLLSQGSGRPDPMHLIGFLPRETEERGGSNLESWGRSSMEPARSLYSSYTLGFSIMEGLSLASSELLSLQEEASEED